ncbi:MAG: ABC transporter ATP-binding protein [Oscillospiraceae bacterium]|nr:ABC transporter ATP-binding protein [Oscillospiraceae bacterium]
MNALEIRNLTKTFKGFKLDDISLTLPSGCIMGLIGENGAGKSTAIKLILNMLHKDSGSVSVLGKDNTENISLTKEDVGVVLDEVGIPECLNIRQVGNIMKNTFKRWDETKFFSMLKKLSVPEKKPFKDFSRGMKMKTGIAVAMSHNAKLLILDEATSGLDPIVRDEVVEMLSDYTREENHSILMSSHIVSDLEKLCDYVAFLHKGKLLLCEEKDILLSKYGIVHCTSRQLSELSPEAVRYKKETPYGSEAMVLREYVPKGMNVSPISIEELFLFTVKGGEAK